MPEVWVHFLAHAFILAQAQHSENETVDEVLKEGREGGREDGRREGGGGEERRK